MADANNAPLLAIATISTPLLSNNLRRDNTDHEPQDAEGDLRKVADSLPRFIRFIAIVGVCERSAYFGILAPMQNYLQNRRDDALCPGGLGTGPSFP
jgi:POT family proton-dependent oligopeptide transporter